MTIQANRAYRDAVLFAALCALPATGHAQAQPVSEDVADVADDSTGIADIVVTAERRTDSLQKSSLDLTVLGESQLQGVTSSSDLTQITPGVQVAPGTATPQVYIRGVGDNAANSRTQSAVAFNIDGVFVARLSSATASFFDLARVEILKGPQGTLYGRNASGGAVNIITNAPRLGEFSGYVGGEVGNYSLLKIGGAINIPVSGTFAARASFQSADRDGYLSDGSQEVNTRAARLRTLWEPSNDVSLGFSIDMNKVSGQGGGVVLIPSPNGDAWRSNTDLPYAYPFRFTPQTAPYTKPDDRFIDSKSFNISAELNWNLGFADLTVIPALRKVDQEYVSYSSTFRFYESVDNTQKSLEARLGRSTGSLKWVAGLYLYDESADSLLAPSNGNLSAVQFDTSIKAWATFAQATLSLTDTLRVIGGLRYTEEKNGGNFVNGIGAPPLVPFVAGAAPRTVVDPIKQNATNWKAGIEFDVGPRSMLYATAATGFKGGGFDQTTACGANIYDPEKLKAFTLGSRNRFADNTLQVNVEGFYWKYNGQQLAALGTDLCGGTTRLTYNVGDSTIKGANVDVQWQPTQSDRFSFAVEYAKGTYDSFVLTQNGQGNYAPAGGSLCSSTAAGGGRFTINCSGLPVSRLPKWTGSASYSHEFELPGGATLQPGVNMTYATKRWLDFAYQPNGRVDGYAQFNAELAFTPAGEDWTVTAWIDNISNAKNYTAGNTLTANSPNGFPYYIGIIAPPRMYGIRARANF